MIQKNRYLIAFAITAIVYTVSIASFLYSFDNSQLSRKSKNNTQIANKVQIAIYQQKFKQEQLKKEKPKEVEKITEKKIEKPKEKKIAKKEVKKETPIKKIVEHTIVQKSTTTTKQKDTVQIDANEIKEKQNRYFELIKQTINQNKTYPKLALRREIECDVKVKFTISKSGELISLEILDGHKAFHKAVKQAIEESFPIHPENEFFGENVSMNLILSYRINTI